MAVTVATSTQASGQIRARYRVTLGGGAVHDVGPVSCTSADHADSLAAGIEATVTEQALETAAEADVSSGAALTTNRQRRACLRRGYQADQAYIAHQYMSRVMPDLLALNRTNSQLASMLDVPIALVVSIKARWQYLSDNAAAITAYATIQVGLV
jgi:hypothetical protein